MCWSGQKRHYFLVCCGCRPFVVRCDAAVTWGFPDLSAGLPRPSLLFDGRRKKRLRFWREGRKRRDDDGGKDKKGISCFKLGICADTDERLKRDPDTFLWVEHRLVSAPLCRCVSPLGGSKKTGFGECRSSVANLAKSERLGGERRVKIFCCFQSM